MKRIPMLPRCLFALMFVLLFSHAAYCAQDLPAAKFMLPAADSAEAKAYLGIKSSDPFPVNSIDAKILILEFFSAMCPECHKNAVVLNKVYKMVSEDPTLKAVKVLGIATDTEKPQLEAYRKNFKVAFPLFLDQSFAISASMDGVEVPTTMVVDAKSGKVLSSHKGVIKDAESLVKEVKGLLKK